MEITLCLKHGKEELENKVNPISETISPVVMSTSSKVNHYHIKQCLTEVYQPLSHLPILKLLDSSDTSAVWFHSSWKNIKCILYQFIQVYIALIQFKLKFSSPIISVNTLPWPIWMLLIVKFKKDMSLFMKLNGILLIQVIFTNSLHPTTVWKF